METALLLFLACALGAGVGGGLLSAWGCHRRILALEQNLKVILTAYDDRIDQLTKIVVRQDKSDAAKARWGGKEKRETEEAAALIKLAGQSTEVAPGHPWDPRTWGKG